MSYLSDPANLREAFEYDQKPDGSPRYRFDEWKEIPKSVFYATVGSGDVIPSCRGFKRPDEGSDWFTRGGRLVGRDISDGPHEHYRPTSRYFVRSTRNTD